MRKRKKKEVTGRHWIYCFAVVPIQVEHLSKLILPICSYSPNISNVKKFANH